MKKVAIIIDGGYLVKIFEDKCGRFPNPDDVIKIANKILIAGEEELFRIYYYNAPPFTGKLQDPITGAETDFSTSRVATSVNSFHLNLSEKDFVALRLGELRPGGWTLPKEVIEGIKNGTITGINRVQLKPVFRQKAVDMKIGLDVALLAVKRSVDRIAMITGDTDFIPAMKFARREGLQVIMVQIAGRLVHAMKEHADQLRRVDLRAI